MYTDASRGSIWICSDHNKKALRGPFAFADISLFFTMKPVADIFQKELLKIYVESKLAGKGEEAQSLKAVFVYGLFFYILKGFLSLLKFLGYVIFKNFHLTGLHGKYFLIDILYGDVIIFEIPGPYILKYGL